MNDWVEVTEDNVEELVARNLAECAEVVDRALAEAAAQGAPLARLERERARLLGEIETRIRREIGHALSDLARQQQQRNAADILLH